MISSPTTQILAILSLALLCGACERRESRPALLDAGAPSRADMPPDASPAVTASPAPILVIEPPKSLLHTGAKHAFATLSGKLASWGDNDYGQLGRGGPRPEAEPGPVKTLGSQGKLVAALGAGTSHSCALMMSGSILCWGSNEYRQLGDGSFDDSKSPVEVIDIDRAAVALSVKGHQGCALIRDGSVRCWGSAMYDSAGTMMGPAPRSDTATPVPGLDSGVTRIAVGTSHACALRDGAVMCWGNNTRGQLGVEDVTDSAQPRSLQGLEVTQLVAGDDFTCGLGRAGSILCWGDDSHGQLGRGDIKDAGSPWRQVALWEGAGKVVQLTAGATHACARLDSGKIACWGSNKNGELGAAGREDGLAVEVEGLGAKALDVRAGQGYTCARTGDAQVSCWGWNMYGQLGRGNDPGDLLEPASIRPPNLSSTTEHK